MTIVFVHRECVHGPHFLRRQSARPGARNAKIGGDGKIIGASNQVAESVVVGLLASS